MNTLLIICTVCCALGLFAQIAGGIESNKVWKEFDKKWKDKQ